MVLMDVTRNSCLSFVRKSWQPELTATPICKLSIREMFSDARTCQGVKGIQIYLGSGTFGISNNVGNTDSEGRCVNQQEVWWDSITIENYWSGNTRKTKQGPNLGLVKENYCKDKQELIEFTKATEKKIAIKVSMKPAEGDNPDSPFVIDSVEVHGEK